MLDPVPDHRRSRRQVRSRLPGGGSLRPGAGSRGGGPGQGGLLKFDLRNRYNFENKVEILSGLADRLGLKNQNPLDLFRDNFVTAPGGGLEASDYPHLAKHLPILESYLRDALAGRRKGVNVFLHGLPVAPAWKAAMAEHEGLVPAVVERAAKVVKHVHLADPGIEASQAPARVMGNTLEAMGAARGPRGAMPMTTVYRPELLSTDADLATLKEGLLDEADSFLQDRKDAQRSWEISQVNEMLTQIEGFEGVFIASTNLMDSLDAAALRRFDLKVHFDYLKPGQAWAMFQDTAGRLGFEADGPARAALGPIRLLTPR